MPRSISIVEGFFVTKKSGNAVTIFSMVYEILNAVKEALTVRARSDIAGRFIINVFLSLFDIKKGIFM